MYFLFVEQHQADKPTEEFQIQWRERPERQSGPVVAAAAEHMNVCQSWMLKLCRDIEEEDCLVSMLDQLGQI